jgi:hypothetical protein
MITLNGKDFINNETNRDLVLTKTNWIDSGKYRRGYMLSYKNSGDVKRTTSAKEMIEFMFKHFK